jgi:hypothetical protein
MMIENKLLITGATGLPGGFFMERLASTKPEIEIHCLIRPTSDRSMLDSLGLPIIYHIGDSSIPETWQQIFSENNFQTIISYRFKVSYNIAVIRLEQMHFPGQEGGQITRSSQ